MSKPILGRNTEKELLDKILKRSESSILIIYGRRRVGKTFFIENSLKSRNLIKIEGIQDLLDHDQIKSAFHQLKKYFKDPLLDKINSNSWDDFFEYVANKTKKGKVTLYLEELQWLANYDSKLLSHLKFWWDNSFRLNPNFLLVLCGSSPSFMINSVVKSKALYNRSQYVMPMNPFTLTETREFMGPRYSGQELMDIYLSIGGIPEYLKYIKGSGSGYQQLCENSFKKAAFFLDEFEKIFTSSLASNKYYKKIIETLAHKKIIDRNQLSKDLKIQSGGSLSDLLTDLQLCGLVDKVTPYNLGERSTLNRYTIADNYLQFYFKFILPLKIKIQKNDYQKQPLRALNLDHYRKWLGYSFERWCRQNSQIIAEILGFGAVEYQSGAYFTRNHPDINSQIDLLFDRKDRTITICEIKYQQAPITKSVIVDFERKIESLNLKKSQTIQKVLITASEPDLSLKKMHYFDRVIMLSDLMKNEK